MGEKNCYFLVYNLCKFFKNFGEIFTKSLIYITKFQKNKILGKARIVLEENLFFQLVLFSLLETKGFVSC